MPTKLFGGKIYGTLKGLGKIRLLMALHSCTIVACALLAILSSKGEAVVDPSVSDSGVDSLLSNETPSHPATYRDLIIRAFLTFVIALGVGVGYYIPPSSFAVEFGGKNCGTVSSLLDLGGFGAAGLFIYWLGPVINLYGWTGAWVLLTFTGLATLLVTVRFLWVLEIGSWGDFDISTLFGLPNGKDTVSKSKKVKQTPILAKLKSRTIESTDDSTSSTMAQNPLYKTARANSKSMQSHSLLADTV